MATHKSWRRCCKTYVLALCLKATPYLTLFIHMKPWVAASKVFNNGGLDLLQTQYKQYYGTPCQGLSVGPFNGLICSIIFATTMLLGFGASLSITVSLSLMCVIVFAALFGTFIPLALEKRDIDPALATGPFITTTNDIIGLIIYFSVSSLVVHSFK